MALYSLLLQPSWVNSSCIKDSQRPNRALHCNGHLSAIAISLALVPACVLQFGTCSFCDFIISLN